MSTWAEDVIWDGVDAVGYVLGTLVLLPLVVPLFLIGLLVRTARSFWRDGEEWWEPKGG